MDGEGMQFSNMMGWTLDLNWSDKLSRVRVTEGEIVRRKSGGNRLWWS